MCRYVINWAYNIHVCHRYAVCVANTEHGLLRTWTLHTHTLLLLSGCLSVVGNNTSTTVLQSDTIYSTLTLSSLTTLSFSEFVASVSSFSREPTFLYRRRETEGQGRAKVFIHTTVSEKLIKRESGIAGERGLNWPTLLIIPVLCWLQISLQ